MKRGDALHRLQLDLLRSGRQPSAIEREILLTGQNGDGGWPHVPAMVPSGLDSTCYRLSTAHAFGLRLDCPAMGRATAFLLDRQRPDGSWDETPALIGSLPPWVQVGDGASILYLTANGGLCLSLLNEPGDAASRAAEYVALQLGADGSLPTYLHAHWLSAALLWRTGYHRAAESICQLLEQNSPSSWSASQAAWLLNTFGAAGLLNRHYLVSRVAQRLMQLQEEDGSWLSEDGQELDVSTTIETLRALQWVNLLQVASIGSDSPT